MPRISKPPNCVTSQNDIEKQLSNLLFTDFMSINRIIDINTHTSSPFPYRLLCLSGYPALSHGAQWRYTLDLYQVSINAQFSSIEMYKFQFGLATNVGDIY